jgi:hypothetical protein
MDGFGTSQETWIFRDLDRFKEVERETGIEPATNGLGSRDSTTELLPLSEDEPSVTPRNLRRNLLAPLL